MAWNLCVALRILAATILINLTELGWGGGFRPPVYSEWATHISWALIIKKLFSLCWPTQNYRGGRKGGRVVIKDDRFSSRKSADAFFFFFNEGRLVLEWLRAAQRHIELEAFGFLYIHLDVASYLCFGFFFSLQPFKICTVLTAEPPTSCLVPLLTWNRRELQSWAAPVFFFCSFYMLLKKDSSLMATQVISCLFPDVVTSTRHRYLTMFPAGWH